MTASRFNLVCVDNSESSNNGFEWYLENYHKSDDKVGLVHVHEMPTLPAIGLLSVGVPLTDEYQKSIEKSVENVRAIKEKYENLCKSKGLNFEFLMTDGHHKPGHMICELAKEKNASSITMGQRGLGTISRALLGSTSDYVLHHSHVPVMVIPKKFE